jgi:L-2-hydroxyglutarate oxidase LhgO
MSPGRSVDSVGVVGAGIVGLAVARRIAQQLPGVRVTVMDKEARVAVHQTGHNRGVVHAGLYYSPGSLKAILCRRGIAMLKEYCTERGLPYEECGKLVVAVDASELPALERIAERATANGVPHLRRLGPEGLRELEPHAVGIAALHSPTTAITDFVSVARAYADDVVAAGGRVELSFPVDAIRQLPDRVEVRSGERLLTFDRLVVCAGLQSDRVAALAGDSAEPAIVPFRGEYYSLRPGREFLVRGLIYPVPDPAYPFLGVHFTKRVGGSVDVGPNAVLALAREGYTPGTIRVRDVRDALAWPGFRRLARRHWRMGAREVAGSLSTRHYLRFARKYVPELTTDDVVRAPAGVRAQAVDRDGSLVDDFRISRLDNVLAVRNAPSPAATSSLAIAEHVLDRLRETMAG